jgi:RNA polymerase sigma factor (sigma-70 family)
MDLFGRDEERAFDKAFHDYFATLVDIVQKFWIDDRHTAETIVIDAFLDIRAKKKHSFRKDGILGLLITTVGRDCIDYLRRQGKEEKKHREFEQWAFEQPLDAEDPLNDPKVVEGELFQRLRDGLEKLPLSQKEILEALLNGTQAKDIAKQRGIRDNTVSITKKNSIENLRKILGQNDTTILLILNFFLNEHLKN